MNLGREPIIAAAAVLVSWMTAGSAAYSQNVTSDFWAAEDALGRKVRSHEDAPGQCSIGHGIRGAMTQPIGCVMSLR